MSTKVNVTTKPTPTPTQVSQNTQNIGTQKKQTQQNIKAVLDDKYLVNLLFEQLY